MVLWIKALHIVAVISWMAGLLYLPRLFVYHCEAEKGSKQSETFKVMEHRLLRYIMNPAMIVVWITGPTLAWMLYVYHDVWMLLKFALVCALTASSEVRFSSAMAPVILPLHTPLQPQISASSGKAATAAIGSSGDPP